MTDQEFAEAIALGHETRGTEFKGPGASSDTGFMAIVVRAVLSMSNRRDGGKVIIGVAESGGTLNPVGLNETDLASWKYDDVAVRISAYADPSVDFELEAKLYDSNSFVILHVEEFADIPVLCKRPYPEVLREGAC